MVKSKMVKSEYSDKNEAQSDGRTQIEMRQSKLRERELLF